VVPQDGAAEALAVGGGAHAERRAVLRVGVGLEVEGVGLVEGEVDERRGALGRRGALPGGDGPGGLAAPAVVVPGVRPGLVSVLAEDVGEQREALHVARQADGGEADLRGGPHRAVDVGRASRSHGGLDGVGVVVRLVRAVQRGLRERVGEVAAGGAGEGAAVGLRRGVVAILAFLLQQEAEAARRRRALRLGVGVVVLHPLRVGGRGVAVVAGVVGEDADADAGAHALRERVDVVALAARRHVGVLQVRRRVHVVAAPVDERAEAKDADALRVQALPGVDAEEGGAVGRLVGEVGRVHVVAPLVHEHAHAAQADAARPRRGVAAGVSVAGVVAVVAAQVHQEAHRPQGHGPDRGRVVLVAVVAAQVEQEHAVREVVVGAGEADLHGARSVDDAGPAARRALLRPRRGGRPGRGGRAHGHAGHRGRGGRRPRGRKVVGDALGGLQKDEPGGAQGDGVDAGGELLQVRIVRPVARPVQPQDVCAQLGALPRRQAGEGLVEHAIGFEHAVDEPGQRLCCVSAGSCAKPSGCGASPGSPTDTARRERASPRLRDAGMGSGSVTPATSATAAESGPGPVRRRAAERAASAAANAGSMALCASGAGAAGTADSPREPTRRTTARRCAGSDARNMPRNSGAMDKTLARMFAK